MSRRSSQWQWGKCGGHRRAEGSRVDAEERALPPRPAGLACVTCVRTSNALRDAVDDIVGDRLPPVSYTHLRAHETSAHL
eukprot:2766056-Alexandrium_andersonii.AAC.1